MNHRVKGVLVERVQLQTAELESGSCHNKERNQENEQGRNGYIAHGTDGEMRMKLTGCQNNTSS